MVNQSLLKSTYFVMSVFSGLSSSVCRYAFLFSQSIVIISSVVSSGYVIVHCCCVLFSVISMLCPVAFSVIVGLTLDSPLTYPVVLVEVGVFLYAVPDGTVSLILTL